MRKARIIVHGFVQGVGYRALVKIIAFHRGLRGMVRNLSDGSVEIYCEGSEENIRQFLMDIHVRDRSYGPLGLQINDIDVYWDKEEGFEEEWRPFTGFEIDYGADDLTLFERENLESLEMAKLRFTELEHVMNSFRDNTNANFEAMAEKYGRILDEITETKKELNKSIGETLPRKISRSLASNFRKLVDRKSNEK